MRYHKGLHRFALFTTACTFLLIIAGGLVTSTGSGLSVPDWPLSYGQLMPPMVGGILFEHGHRMIATFVGLLTVVLALWLWRKEERKWLRILGFVALGAVILQGVLGGLTVLFLLPTPISVAHAALAQTFFSLVATIALVTSRWWIDDTGSIPACAHPSGTLKVAAFATIAVFLQLVFGALMRHSGSGLAVPDFPFAYGQVLPSLAPEAVAGYNATLIALNVRIAADGPISGDQIAIHLLHRYWAIVVVVLLVWLSMKLFRQRDQPTRSRTFASALLILIVFQIILGAFTVLSRKSVVITTAHVATGAMILVTLVILTLRLARAAGYRPAFGLRSLSKEATA